MRTFKFVLIIAISIFPVWLQAKHISPETARKVAETQVRSHSQLRSAPVGELDLVYVKTAVSTKAGAQVQTDNAPAQTGSAPADVLYYVFNAGESGFVIVSGDDIARPVLGYSNTSAYDPDNLPPNFVYYLDDFLAKEIEYAIANDTQQDEKTKKQWEAFHDGNVSTRASVSPLLSTQWNQGSPYNGLCPNSSYTGCVATAMAQIMKYHNHPASPTLPIPAYITRTNNWSIPAITTPTNYAWGSMTFMYSGSSTQPERDAVATLMYHCGVAVEMDYTTSGSGAYTNDVGLALINYFDYDQSINYLERTYYTNQQLEDLLSFEINAGRPVFYAGSNSSSGHAFVCDGYEDVSSQRKFHFNWGWGGYQDGHFVTTALNPGSGGAGSGPGTYNEDQLILINIKPDSGGDINYSMNIKSQTNISASKTTLDRGESFTVNAPMHNTGLFSFTGHEGIAIVDASDNIIEIIGQSAINNLLPGHFYNNYNIFCTIPVSASPGSCLIKGVYKVNSASQWTIATGTPGYTDILNLTITNNAPQTHGIKILSGVNLASSATTVNRGEIFTASAQFTNGGAVTMTGEYGIALVDNSDQILEIIGVYRSGSIDVPLSLNPGSTWSNSFAINCAVSYAITTGSYKIRAVFKPTGENWSIVFAQTTNIDILNLTVNSGTVPDASAVRMSSTLPVFTANPNIVNQFSPLNVVVRIANPNTAGSSFIGELELGIYDYPSGTTLLEVIGTRNAILPNNSTYYDFTFNTSSVDLPGGDYILYLYQKGVDGIKKKVADNTSAYRNYLELEVIGILPNVTAVSPAGATNVPIAGQLIITFDKAMNTSQGVGVVTLGGGFVSNESKSWSIDNMVCTIPYTGLAYNTSYTCNISGFKDASGNMMAPITSGYTFTTLIPPVTTVTWTGSGMPSDWDDPANWDTGTVPTYMDTVVIEEVFTHYPVLQNSVTVAAIRFKPGAQLGNQSKLTGKAFVQYSLSNLNRRDRWNMLSVPLGEAYPGDFTFGGYPFTWISTFETSSGGGSVTMGDWSVALGNSQKLTPGDGFVLWLNFEDEYPMNKTPSDFASKGLKLSNDIHELPFFHRHLLGDPEYARYKMMHPAHDYAETSGVPGVLGNSTFYDFEFNVNTYQRIPANNYSVQRNDTAFRLVAGNVIKTLDFGANSEAGGIVALVGNPYMAGLDFEALYQSNSSEIKPAYQIWTGSGYSVFTLHGYSGNIVSTHDMTNLIAPLQSFLVEEAESPVSGSLLFDESMTDVTAPGITLRSSARTGNKLDIIAHTPTAGILTFIARREGGQDTFGNQDARKILNGISDLPEVYTLKPYKGSRVAAAVNIIDSDDLLIPVGLATGYTGDITLTFRGMDTYDANIFLIDAETNRTVDLTGLTSYEYVVDYTPKKVNGQTAVCEDRFAIRISPATTGLPAIADGGNVTVLADNGTIRIASVQSDPIREVAVYNLQGMVMYSATAINAPACTVDRKWPAGVYIVKVTTENTVENVKIIIQ